MLNLTTGKFIGITGSIVGATTIGGGTAIYFTSANNPTKQKDISKSENTKLSIPPKINTKDKTIFSLLEGKRLLTKNNTDDEKWNAPWQEFRKIHADKSPEEPWVFNDWPQNKDVPETLTSFKDQCVKLGEEKVSGKEDKVYLEVEKYCTTKTNSENA